MSAYDPIAAVLGPGGMLAEAIPGYEHRPPQLAMAQAVARSLADGTPLLVEAGTGTGKTLAYLVPALLSGKKVVVSTGTKALQEQILAKDVPLLARHLDRPVEVAVLKGISNYLCARRAAEIGDTRDPDLVRILEWSKRTVTGDRAELAGVADDALAWKQVTTTPDARLGPRCPFFERCFVTQARRAAAKAQLVIVNHHLFFADLALRATYPGAQVLPAYDAVVFDEAHQLEDIATEHFGVSVSTLRALGLVRDGRKTLVDITSANARELRRTEEVLGNVEARSEELFTLLRQHLEQRGPGAGGSGGGDAFERRFTMPPDLFAEGERRDRWFKLDAALEELAARAAARAESLGDDKEREEPAALGRRAEAFRRDLASLAERDEKRRHVHWAEIRGRAVFLRASPLDIGPLMRSHVVEPVGAVVFTSATITTDGRFDFVRARLGLRKEAGWAGADADASADANAPWADELAVESPFDYAAQSLLYLPRDLPAPQDPGFGDAAVARILELVAITKGRAFVLFTSHRALKHAAAQLRPRLERPIFVQGDEPRPVLLEKFRAARTDDGGAVLLATSSFWEGIDVPGDALSMVILEKLPFAAPDDPITSARVSLIEERGGEPFMGYQVPRAALALKQGFGRLIRRKDDRGIVAVLDHRIVTKQYGRVFVSSLPPAARTSALEQVRRWWEKGC